MRKIVLLSIIVIIIIAVLAITVSYIFVYTHLPQFAISVLSQDPNPHIVENSYVRLSTDKSTYSKGEPVVFTIKNNSPYDFYSSSKDYGMWMYDIYHNSIFAYGCPTCTAISTVSANSSFTDTWQPHPDVSGTIRVCNSLSPSSGENSYAYTLCNFIIINDD